MQAFGVAAAEAWRWADQSTIAVHRYTRLLLVALLNVSCASDWPPPVGSAAEVRELAVATRSVRCIACDDSALVEMAGRLRELDYLFINSSAIVSDHGIGAFSGHPRLRQIVILNAARLTDASMGILATLPHLEELSIDEAPHITSGGLRRLAGNKALRVVNLTRCAGADASTVVALRAELPQAEIRAFD